MFEEQFPMFLDFITQNNLNFRTRNDLARAFSSAFQLDFTTAYSTIGDMKRVEISLSRVKTNWLPQRLLG